MKNYRAVHFLKRGLKNQNIYSPEGFIEEGNKLGNMDVRLFDFRDPKRPCFTGWEGVFNMLIDLPVGYTHNYSFDFIDGTAYIRHSSLSHSAPLIVKMVPDGQKERTKHQFITALYGINVANQTTQLTEIWDSPNNNVIILPRISAPAKIPAKRAAHIVNKLRFVPQQHHSYYDSLKRDAGDIVLNTSDISEGDGPWKRKQKKKKVSYSLSQLSDLYYGTITSISGTVIKVKFDDDRVKTLKPDLVEHVVASEIEFEQSEFVKAYYLGCTSSKVEMASNEDGWFIGEVTKVSLKTINVKQTDPTLSKTKSFKVYDIAYLDGDFEGQVFGDYIKKVITGPSNNLLALLCKSFNKDNIDVKDDYEIHNLTNKYGTNNSTIEAAPGILRYPMEELVREQLLFSKLAKMYPDSQFVERSNVMRGFIKTKAKYNANELQK